MINSGLIASASWFNSYLALALFDIIYSVWILSEILNFVISKNNPKGKKKDRGSFWIIVIGLMISLGSSFSFRSNGIGVFFGWIQYFGIGLMTLGVALREWAVFTLGRGFTVHVHVQHKGQLITRGPYKFVRHPSYTGGILTMIGLPLAMGTWAGFVLTIAIIPIIYRFRINAEEKALVEAYGKDYKNYMKKSWRLVPWIY